MRTTRLATSLAAACLGVACMVGCPGDDGGAEPPGEETGNDMGDDMGDDDGSQQCPGNPDPACTTDAACGNGQVCSACECVDLPPDCANPQDPECASDADCGSSGSCEACVCVFGCSEVPDAACIVDDDCFAGGTCSEADGCTCIGEPPCSDPAAECGSDADCGDGICDLEQCLCAPVCECDAGDVGACRAGELCDGCNCVTPSGEPDPSDDCADDLGATPCDPSVDIVATEISCIAGEIAVALTFAETPIEAMPEILTERSVMFWDDTDTAVLGLFARATTTPTPSDYACDINIPGVMLSPLGPDDRCAISRDGNRFEFVLSADSAMLARSPIATVSAFSSNANPAYHFDDTERYPVVCPIRWAAGNALARNTARDRAVRGDTDGAP